MGPAFDQYEETVRLDPGVADAWIAQEEPTLQPPVVGSIRGLAPACARRPLRQQSAQPDRFVRQVAPLRVGALGIAPAFGVDGIDGRQHAPRPERARHRHDLSGPRRGQARRLDGLPDDERRDDAQPERVVRGLILDLMQRAVDADRRPRASGQVQVRRTCLHDVDQEVVEVDVVGRDRGVARQDRRAGRRPQGVPDRAPRDQGASSGRGGNSINTDNVASGSAICSPISAPSSTTFAS